MKEFVKENNNLIGKGKEKNYYIMCLINFLHGLIFFGAITTIFRTQRGLSLEEMIIMESVFIVSIIIFEIPLGIIADKFGHSKTIMIGCFLLFISRIMFYDAYTFIAFLAQRFIVGIGIAAMSGCDSAIIYEAVEEEDRQKAFGRYMMYGTISFFVASICSSFMSVISLEFTVLATIVPYGIAFLVSLFLIDEKKIKKSEDKKISIENLSIKKISSDVINIKGIVILTYLITLVGYAGSNIDILFGPLQFEKVQINVAMFGIITAITEIPCMLSGQVYKVTEKIGDKKAISLFIGSLLVASAGLIFTKSKIVSVLLIVLAKFSFSMLSPIIMDIENNSIKAESENRATILSAYSMLSGIIEVGLSFLVALFVTGSVQIGFIIMTILIIIAFSIFTIFKDEIIV